MFKTGGYINSEQAVLAVCHQENPPEPSCQLHLARRGTTEDMIMDGTGLLPNRKDRAGHCQ